MINKILIHSEVEMVEATNIGLLITPFELSSKEISDDLALKDNECLTMSRIKVVPRINRPL